MWLIVQFSVVWMSRCVLGQKQLIVLFMPNSEWAVNIFADRFLMIKDQMGINSITNHDFRLSQRPLEFCYTGAIMDGHCHFRFSIHTKLEPLRALVYLNTFDLAAFVRLIIANWNVWRAHISLRFIAQLAVLAMRCHYVDLRFQINIHILLTKSQ